MTTFVVYDLEYTSWEGALARNWSGPGEHREIVQIGAVRLDRRFQELASLNLVVRPAINPVLSDYFIQLTGLSQERVERDGMSFAQALDRLRGFAHPDLMLLANGTDAEVVAENCRLSGLDDPFIGRTRNINPILREALGLERTISADLPALFGLPAKGRGHDALVDARNVAAALAHLAADGRFSL